MRRVRNAERGVYGRNSTGSSDDIFSSVVYGRILTGSSRDIFSSTTRVWKDIDSIVYARISTRSSDDIFSSVVYGRVLTGSSHDIFSCTTRVWKDTENILPRYLLIQDAFMKKSRRYLPTISSQRRVHGNNLDGMFPRYILKDAFVCEKISTISSHDTHLLNDASLERC